MLIALTRFAVDAVQPPDTSKFEAASRAAHDVDGWMGAQLWQSADDPSMMMRITMWRDRAAREAWHASATAKRLGLGLQAGTEQWELVVDDRPDGRPLE